jgi:hypothetical protein
VQSHTREREKEKEVIIEERSSDFGVDVCSLDVLHTARF